MLEKKFTRSENDLFSLLFVTLSIIWYNLYMEMNEVKFSNIYEEEQSFPYMDISLEEAREIRHLICNMPAFSNGEVVQMGLKNMDKYVYGNGMFGSCKGNKTFESYVYKEEYGYKIFTVIFEILTHKDYYSIDEFIFRNKDIEVISSIENKGSLSKRISYPEEFSRK